MVDARSQQRRRPLCLIEGIYQGREELLQVLAYAPDEEEPGVEVEAE